MLVVDVHALAAIDALHLADEVVLHGVGAADAKNVVRHQRTIDERIAFLDVVIGVHAQVFAVRHGVFLFHADRLGVLVHRLDDDDALALLFLA